MLKLKLPAENRIMDRREQIITPWAAQCDRAGFDYNRIVADFGCEPISAELLARFRAVTGCDPHPWLTRGIYFAHRGFSEILEWYENSRPIVIYTGRGPSSMRLHLGHLIPFEFTAWLQKVFGADVVIMIADEEKYYCKGLAADEIDRMCDENIADIIACGWDPARTCIYRQSEFSATPRMRNIIRASAKHISIHTICKIFGIDEAAPVGHAMWPLHQCAAAFAAGYEWVDPRAVCLGVCAVDQDVYFRLCRDIAPKLSAELKCEMPKPCVIQSKFLLALNREGKMSSDQAAIWIGDTPDQVLKKIRKFAFSGGRDTLEQHRQYGGDISVDMSYELLCYFELDDDKLRGIAADYTAGILTSGQIKQLAAASVSNFLAAKQTARAAITPEIMSSYYPQY